MSMLESSRTPTSKYKPYHSLCLAMIGMLVLTFCIPAASGEDKISRQQAEFFESHIRPVLIENCYSCHNSVDKAEGDFALDYRGGIRKQINIKSPKKSRLLSVIRHEIEDLEMPSGGARLPPKVISDFARWIEMGAPDPRNARPNKQQLAKERSWESILTRRKQWWCFRPIRNPSVPMPKKLDWSDHPVDRFILKQLESAKLKPAAEASRATLIRRLTFALNGLPPTPKQIAAFEADKSPDAFESLVDRLLESNQFGERWARHWMDWIRYAESHGSEGDPAIPHAYRYRDYLIRSLNSDVPYDQLVREHIAGDLLSKPRINTELGINESALATAHWRMVFHGFAPTDALDEKVRFTDDQINAFSKAFLGLTVSCARCHNHKFDAISQADYYALFGILGSTRPSMLDVNTIERQQLHRDRLLEIKKQLRTVIANHWQAQVEKISRTLPTLNPAWSKAIDAAKQPDHALHTWWQVRRDPNSIKDFGMVWRGLAAQWKNDSKAISVHQQRHYEKRWLLHTRNDYQAWFQTGNGLPKEPAQSGEFALAPTGDQVVVGIYPAGAYTHAISTKHRGILTSPEFHLDGDFDLWVRVAGDAGAMIRYAVQNYPRNGTVYPVSTLKSGQWKWQRFPLKYWNGDDIHIELTTAADAPLLARANARSWFGVREAVLVRSGQPSPPGKMPEQAAPLFDLAEKSTPKSLGDLKKLYLQTLRQCVVHWRDGRIDDGESLFLNSIVQAGLLTNQTKQLAAANVLLREYRKLEQQIPEPTRIVGLAEVGGHDQRLFLRGNHKQPGDPVPRRFLEAIDKTPYDTQQSGRLELARDLLRRDNPLTARVIVNRLWHHLFGRGLVDTPDNFGRLGGTPSHPELLDYLATRIAEREWSIKDTIRFLVSSQTWRQGSNPSELARQLDPDNRLLSHANIRRLEAEAIRDSLLFVSGRLDSRMYGGSVGGKTSRRSIYVQVRRNSLDPFLRVFDFPEPFSATGRRDVTNVPAQSLTMMNDRFVNDLASAWAARVLAEGERDDRSRVGRMYEQALGRRASQDEVDAALSYLAEVRGTSTTIVRQINSLRSEILRQQKTVSGIMQPVRARLLADLKSTDDKPADLEPIARWEFDKDLRDSVGEAHGVAFGRAHIASGSLIVDGRDSYVVTKPLKTALTAKTLEVWVQLSNLKQRAGGVMTVQTPNGAVFDSIVFAEQSPQEWLAGSNNFRRTRPFAGTKEASADNDPVHIVIAYHADGRIVGYRNGKPYGSGYTSNGLQKFAAGRTTIAFGVRHLPAGGNKMLTGRIVRAQLYDRALTSEEVEASSKGTGKFVSSAKVLAALAVEERKRIKLAHQTIERLEKQLVSLGPIPDSGNTKALWADMANALFNFKEFIYIP